MAIDRLAAEAGRLRAGRVRVLVVDDHAVVRTALRTLLEAAGDIETCGEAADATAGVAAARALRPDVVLLDVGLPDRSGLDTLAELRDASPEAAVVVLSFEDDPLYEREARRRGASGFVLKEQADDEVVAAVRAAAALAA